MVFNPRQKRWKLDIRLEISNCAIDRVRDTIFLGVILDENFTRKHDIANVTRKISKSIGIIYRSSFCLRDTSLRTLYYTLVYLYLAYCVSVWASTHSHKREMYCYTSEKICSSYLQETIWCLTHWSYMRSNKDICKYWSSMIYICFKLEMLFIFMANQFHFLILKLNST